MPKERSVVVRARPSGWAGFFPLEDQYGRVEVVVFPKTYARVDEVTGLTVERIFRGRGRRSATMQRRCGPELSIFLLVACGDDPGGGAGETSTGVEGTSTTVEATSTTVDDAGSSDDEAADGSDGAVPDLPDVPEIPDGLFFASPYLSQGLAVSEAHLFVMELESFFDDARVVRIDKSDASAEIFAVAPFTYATFDVWEGWLYGTTASDIVRAPVDGVGPLMPIATVGGPGGFGQVVFGSDAMYAFRFGLQGGATDTITRFGLEGGPGSLLLTSDVQEIDTGGDRLFGLVNAGSLVEIDTQSGSLTPLQDGVQRFVADADQLYFLLADDTVYRMSHDGGDATVLLTPDDQQGVATSLVSDDQHLYWAVASFGSGTASVRRVDKTGGVPEVVFEYDHTQAPQDVRLDETHVYWTMYFAEAHDDAGVWRVTK